MGHCYVHFAFVFTLSSNIILINIIFMAYEINTAVTVSDLLPRKTEFAHNLMQELLLDKQIIYIFFTKSNAVFHLPICLIPASRR